MSITVNEIGCENINDMVAQANEIRTQYAQEIENLEKVFADILTVSEKMANMKAEVGKEHSSQQMLNKALAETPEWNEMQNELTRLENLKEVTRNKISFYQYDIRLITTIIRSKYAQE